MFYLNKKLYQFLYFFTCAGLPATIAYSGTSFVTTEHAPIIEWLPIFTPGRIVTFPPIYTSSPISTGKSSEYPCSIIGLDKSENL